MPNYLLPQLGTAGHFTLATPLDLHLTPGVRYTVVGTRLISDYLTDQVDVLALVYIPNGLTEADFAADQAENMAIVTLQGSDGHVYYVPVRYIQSAPKTDGVGYHDVALQVGLGPMPLGYDYASFQAELSDVVYDRLGIRPSFTVTEINLPVLVTAEEDLRIKTARAVQPGQIQSYRGLYLQALQQIQNLLNRCLLLEDCLKSKL